MRIKRAVIARQIIKRTDIEERGRLTNKKKSDTIKEAATNKIFDFVPGKFLFVSSRIIKSEKKIIGALVLYLKTNNIIKAKTVDRFKRRKKLKNSFL